MGASVSRSNSLGHTRVWNWIMSILLSVLELERLVLALNV